MPLKIKNQPSESVQHIVASGLVSLLKGFHSPKHFKNALMYSYELYRDPTIKLDSAASFIKRGSVNSCKGANVGPL